MQLPKPRLSWGATTPSSLFIVPAGRQTQRTMLASVDKAEDFRDRRIRRRERLHRVEPFGKDSRGVEKLLIERPDGGQSFARKFAPFHPDDIETFETRVLAVDETVGNNVAANAADAADHGLRTNSGELMYRRQAADEDKIADFTMTAKRSRGREDDVIADLAVMTDMTAIHEVTAVADRGKPAAPNRAGIH